MTLSSMNLAPNWLVIFLKPTSQLKVSFVRSVLGTSPRGISSSGSGAVGGVRDHPCRCVWFPRGNLPTLTPALAVLRGRSGTCSPLINRPASDLGIDSSWKCHIPFLVKLNLGEGSKALYLTSCQSEGRMLNVKTTTVR